MAVPDVDPQSRERRQLAMLHAISRSLSGRLSVPEAIAEIAASAREFLEFERIAILLNEGDALRVHAVVNPAAWNEGRLLRREECSARLWVEDAPDIIHDAREELDGSLPMDREILDRGTRSVLRVPLVGRDGRVGVLVISHDQPNAYGPQDEATLSAIAGLVALALEHERLHRLEVRRQSRLAALEAVLPQIADTADLDEIITTISRLAMPILPHNSIGISVLYPGGAKIHGILPGGQRVTLQAADRFIQAQIQAIVPQGYARIRDIDIVDEEKKIIRLHVERGRERKHFDVEVPPEGIMLRKVGVRSQLRAGVHRGQDLVGVLVFSDSKPDAFDDDDIPIAMRFAERISLRLAHRRILDEAQRATEESARAQVLEERVALLQRELEEARGPHAVVGRSKSWQEVLGHATRVAGTETTVLLTGESGTGKEVVARFIHHASARAQGPFVAINCAALPEQLLEGELFGHEKGAFTGAAATRIGRIEQAAGGVLFLDEVAEMSPTVQAKFLRVLQEREYQRLGGARVLKADARIIAATNRDLKAMIATGNFREDLYYRLHVFAIHLSPLRERPDDVMALTEHFLAELATTLGRGPAGMTAEARDAIRGYAWPGNARELRNVIERALILCDGALIGPSHLAVSGPPAKAAPAASAAAAAVQGAAPAAAVAPAPAVAAPGFGEGPLPAEGIDIEALERSLVQRAMGQAAGNKSKAAKLLGLTRGQLYSRLEKYSVETPAPND